MELELEEIWKETLVVNLSYYPTICLEGMETNVKGQCYWKIASR
jgi:hypothetical protein